MAKNNIKSIFWFVIIVPIILIIGLGSLTIHQLDVFKENKKWADHTHEVLIHVNKIAKLMVDLETGQRGFIITGKENFLEPFNASEEIIFKETKRLKHKVSDSPLQVARMDSVEQKIKNWLRTAGNPEIESRRQYNQGKIQFDEVAALLMEETGKQQIDDLRNILNQFYTVEKELLIQRNTKQLSEIEQTKKFVLLGVIAISIINFLMALFLSKKHLTHNK